MKKLLILLLILSSCKKEVYYYPSKVFFEENSPKEIIIDQLSFEEITDSIRNGLYRKENYFLSLVDKNKKYLISPFAYTGGFIKEKNALEIIDDSIYVFINKYPLTQLSKYLKLHYENNGNVEYLSDSYKRAFIKIVFNKNDNDIKLKKVLLKVIKAYNETDIISKDSIDLAIMLDYPLDKRLTTPPPPTIIEN